MVDKNSLDKTPVAIISITEMPETETVVSAIISITEMQETETPVSKTSEIKETENNSVENLEPSQDKSDTIRSLSTILPPDPPPPPAGQVAVGVLGIFVFLGLAGDALQQRKRSF